MGKRVKVTKVCRSIQAGSENYTHKVKTAVLNKEFLDLSTLWRRAQNVKIESDNPSIKNRVREKLRSGFPENLKAKLAHGNVLLEGYVTV